MKIKESVSLVKDLIFVPRCVSCACTLPPSSGAMCDTCREQYENAIARQCGVCGRAMPQCLCVYSEYRVKKVKKFVKLFRYDPRNRESAENRLIYRLKNSDVSSIRTFAASQLAHSLEGIVAGSEGDFAVTYPPRSLRAVFRHDFDHMLALAKKLAELTGTEFLKCFYRVGLGGEQKKLSSSERAENAEKSYALRHGIDLTGKKIIIVDDVVTSGATLKTCTELLYEAGASEVIWASLGVTKQFREKDN